MLAFNTEEPSVPDYSVLDGSIKETLTAIDRFEIQAISEIAKMRNDQLYKQAGYKTFTEYCANELMAWGGIRRINQLLATSRVKEVAGELGEHIKNERQARPLVRLADEPEKLKEAIALAVQENPSPSQADFARAANNVVPKPPRKKKVQQEPLVPKLATVTVVSESHPRYGQQGTIDKPAPNDSQQLVSFDDGEELLINNDDLDAPSVPYPQRAISADEHTRAIADLEQQYKLKMERLEQELTVRWASQARDLAEQQVAQELKAMRELYLQEKEEKIKWKQLADELEGLRQLVTINQQQQERIQELENDPEPRPVQDWGNTFSKQAAKVVNKELERAYKQTIDLRSLAQEPPQENASECLRLMGLALGNLATAMNNTQALEAAALILGSQPTVEAIAHRAEQLQMLPVAISEIREVLATPGSTWQEFLAVAEKYQEIKKDFWAELTPHEKELINGLKQAFEQAAVPPPTELPVIGVGSIVAHTDAYSTLYNARGEVIEDLGDEVWVSWEHWQDKPKKSDRYFKTELRPYQGDNN